MIPSYSIAEARNRFAEIVHDLKRVPRVEVTRRGRAVAILISVEEFESLCTGNVSFASAYEAFRASHNVSKEEIEPQIFENLRDQSEGRGDDLVTLRYLLDTNVISETLRPRTGSGRAGSVARAPGRNCHCVRGLA